MSEIWHKNNSLMYEDDVLKCILYAIKFSEKSVILELVSQWVSDRWTNPFIEELCTKTWNLDNNSNTCISSSLKTRQYNL